MKMIRFLFLFFFIVCCTKKAQRPLAPNLPQEVTYQKTQEGAKLYFKFVNPIAGSQPNTWLAKSGDIEVNPEEIHNTVHYEIVQKKKNDILFVLFYRQYVAYSKKIPQNLIFFGSLLNTNIQSLLSQYGIPFRKGVNIEFHNSDSTRLASIDGKNYKISDIDKNHYLWGAYQTELFQIQLNEIDKKIKNKRLAAEARAQNINVQDYRALYINKHLDKQQTQEEIEVFRLKKSLPATKQGRKQAREMYTQFLEKKNKDYFLEKYLLELPILVNLKAPQFKLQLAKEYVPTYGQSHSNLGVVIMADSASSISQKLVEQIGALLTDYTGLYLEYRPILSENNPFQDTRALIETCIWQLFPDKFWNVLVRTQNNFKERVQDEIYKIIKQEGLSVSEVDRCRLTNEAKKVLEYHRGYAKYLGVEAGPVVFVGGEVLLPPIDIKRLKKVINRYLGVKDGALWDGE